MRTLFVGLALSTLVACSTSTDDDTGPVPEGDWSVTLTFTTGNCSGLPDIFAIEFSIGQADGGYTFTVEQGLTGDTIADGSTITCDSDTCTLDFSDSGPGTEDSNVDTQTITATLTQDTGNNVTGSGQIEFDLNDGTSCTQSFTGDGAVTQ
jgi:hypothetical protein